MKPMPLLEVAASDSVAKLTARDMRALLRERHNVREWAINFEVANSTGYSSERRWADAVAIHLWPSRGNAVHGYEIKVSRGDWVRELNNPKKAEEIEQFCDYWWVCAPKGVVTISELPTTWGLMEADGRGLRVVVQAAKRQNVAPLTRGFIAAMLRRSAEKDEGEIGAVVEKRLEPLREQLKDRTEREITRRLGENAELAKKVAAFEAASGLTLTGWQGGTELGAAVRLVLDMGLASTWGTARLLANSARQLADAVDKAMATMPETPMKSSISVA